MNEQVIRIGKTKSLVGIMTEPSSPGRDIAYLLLNAGLIHRVGPNRIYVRLARHLAAHGFTCVRFDISGLGDSEMRHDGLPYHESRLHETKEVLDYLEKKKNIKRFVLLGLCSGADHAFRVACLDERIIGAVMLDGYAYRTQWSSIKRYGRAALHFTTWLRLLNGSHPFWYSFRQKTKIDRPDEDKDEYSTFVMDIPPREQVETSLNELVKRGVKLFFIYMSSFNTYNYETQFQDMFPSVPLATIRVDFWPDCDHTYTLLSHQDRLMRALLNWSEGISLASPAEVECHPQVSRESMLPTPSGLAI